MTGAGLGETGTGVGSEGTGATVPGVVPDGPVCGTPVCVAGDAGLALGFLDVGCGVGFLTARGGSLQ